MSVLEYIATFDWYIWVLILFGLVLLVIEALQPGLGIPGILGAAAMILAVIFQAGTVMEAVIMLAVLAAVCGMLFLAVVHSLYKGRLSKSDLTLQDTGKQNEAAHHYDGYIGKKGTAVTPLRPVGIGRFGEEQFEVLSQTKRIEEGAAIVIVAAEGRTVFVRKAEDSETNA